MFTVTNHAAFDDNIATGCSILFSQHLLNAFVEIAFKISVLDYPELFILLMRQFLRNCPANLTGIIQDFIVVEGCDSN